MICNYFLLLHGILKIFLYSVLWAFLLLFSHSVALASLRPHGLQHSSPPCPSLSSRVRSNSCPLSLWCHPTISSSVIPFSCSQSFQAWGSFPVSWLFTSGWQSVGASASVLPMNIQGWFPLGLTGLISLLVQRTLRSLLQHQFESINSSALTLLYGPTLRSIHDCWKNHSFDYMHLCQQSDVSAF